MEFKLFPGEDVPEFLRDDLTTFWKLPKADRKFIEDYLRGLGSAEDDDGRYWQLVRQSSLQPDDFDRISGAVRFVLEAWYRQKLELSDVIDDLAVLLEEELLGDEVFNTLDGLVESREALVRAGETDFVQRVGIQTIEDVNIICEYRPVFEERAYPPTSDTHRYTKIVGLTPLIILEVVTNDYGDRTGRSAFQFTEREFIELRDSMNRALEQLEAMKKAIQIGPQGAKGRIKKK